MAGEVVVADVEIGRGMRDLVVGRGLADWGEGEIAVDLEVDPREEEFIDTADLREKEIVGPTDLEDGILETCSGSNDAKTV